MTGRWGKRVAAVGIAAVIGAAVGAASMTAASAVSVPLDADFGIVMPGATAQSSADVTVARASFVTHAEWLVVSGTGSWSASLCSDASCTPLADLTGASLAAGDYRVVIEVTMPMDASTVDSHTSARGRLALVEAIELPLTTDEGLAATGATAPWIAALVGAGALGGGVALLLRRRRPHEEDAR